VSERRAYGHVDGTWAPTPRIVEIWDEIGELLGIGPRPRSAGLVVDHRDRWVVH
jgi:hypothetical protein